MFLRVSLVVMVLSGWLSAIVTDLCARGWNTSLFYFVAYSLSGGNLFRFLCEFLKVGLATVCSALYAVTIAVLGVVVLLGSSIPSLGSGDNLLAVLGRAIGTFCGLTFCGGAIATSIFFVTYFAPALQTVLGILVLVKVLDWLRVVHRAIWIATGFGVHSSSLVGYSDTVIIPTNGGVVK